MKGGELRTLVPLVVVLLTPQTADAAFTARTTATATFSAAESFGPRNVVAPAIVGNAVAGQTLTANLGQWEPAAAPVSLRWELETAGVFQVVGTASTYVLPATSAGKRIRVVASSGTVSAPSAAVLVAAPAVPVNTGLPAIEGSIAVNATLTGTTGGWANLPTSYTREWLRCAPSGSSCSVVAGQTSASYALATSDIGYVMRHRVTARNVAGSSTATSAPSAALAPAPKSVPSISGVALTSSRLDFYAPFWTQHPTLPTTEAITWWRCPDASETGCVQVGDGPSYTAVGADVGKYMRARQTLTQNGVVGETRAPQTIGPIAALPPRLIATVTTNVPNAPATAYAADGSTATVWTTTSPKRAGQWVRLDFGGVRTLVAYEVTSQEPGAVCEVSSDGLAWTAIAQDSERWTPGPGTAFTPPIRARFLRLRLTADGPDGWWLNDIRVWGS